MTDKTQPEALRLALSISLMDTFTNYQQEELDKAAAELRRQHARIAELESELEAVGAGGVQALSAAPAEALAELLRLLTDKTPFPSYFCNHKEYYECSDCGEEHEDYAEILHAETCDSVKAVADRKRISELVGFLKSTPPAEQQAPDDFQQFKTGDAELDTLLNETFNMARGPEHNNHDTAIAWLDAVETIKARLRQQAATKSDGFYEAINEMDGLYQAASKAAPGEQPTPVWIVNDLGELGVHVNGRFFFLYKGDNIEYGKNGGVSALHDDGTPMRYRVVGKREFGEVCHPLEWMVSGRSKSRYSVDLVYTPGLSFGKPEDSAWRTLPAAPPAEQQAQPGAVYAELPEHVAEVVDPNQGEVTSMAGEPVGLGDCLFTITQLRDFADRTHALRMKAVAAAANAAGMLLVKTAGNTYALVENSTATATMHPSRNPQAAPKAAAVAAFEDARVQVVYNILVDDEAPPAGEHWEGFIARRIIDALAAPKAAPGGASADSLRHQNKLLAETLGACILASGIVRKDIDGFTGPELLQFGEDLRSMLEAAPQQEAQGVDSTALDAAMRAIQQSIELIGEPADERMRAVRRVLRGAVIVAEDAGEAASAPQQEAQEPVVAAVFDEQLGRPVLIEGAPLLRHGQELYTAPQPAPATRQAANYPPLPTAIGFAHFFEGELINAHSPRFQAEFNEEGEFDDHNVELFTADQMRAYVDADRTARASAESAGRDAERYRWLRAPRLAAGQGSITVELDDRANGDFSRSIFLADLDAAIDAAIAAQGGKA